MPYLTPFLGPPFPMYEIQKKRFSSWADASTATQEILQDSLQQQELKYNIFPYDFQGEKRSLGRKPQLLQYLCDLKRRSFLQKHGNL